MPTILIGGLVVLAVYFAIKHVKKTKGSCCDCPGAATCNKKCTK